MRQVLDLVLAAATLLAALPLVVVLGLTLRLVRHTHTARRRIVYLGTGQIAQVFPRNGVNLFLERECSDFGGYFEQLWNIHFPAGGRGALDLSPRHHLIDFDVRSGALLPRTSVVLRE